MAAAERRESKVKIIELEIDSKLYPELIHTVDRVETALIDVHGLAAHVCT